MTTFAAIAFVRSCRHNARMLAFDDLSVRVAGRLLIDRATVQIPAGARVGLVGRNGSGKTTLLRAIAGEIAPERGTIRSPQRARIGRLVQEAPDGPQSLLDTVLAADRERSCLLEEAETAQEANRIAEIQTRLADMGSHAAPARAAAVLAGLGFSPAAQRWACAEFSGGWRLRVALAAVLFAEPDVLLLDEPTNYLDLEGTLWLEEHLTRYPHTVLLVSHDRDLLERAVDYILHLDRGRLVIYRGGFSAFARQRQQRQTLDLKAARNREAERRRLQGFVDRFRAKASKARQAQSRLKLLAKLEPAAAVVADHVRPIEIAEPAIMLSPPIIALDDVAAGYSPGRPVLKRVTLRIDTDDRIALLGANGNGKSTLAKLLAGRLVPSQGRVIRAQGLAVAYFAQHQLDELSAGDSAYDHVSRLMPDAPEAKVRARVGALGFSAAAADTPVAQLSGGEKARLLLGLATLVGPHLVILDEPTNHLDIDSRAALVAAINAYPGAVILVSHDRFLLDACAERLWIVADGTVRPFDGDLDDYRRLVVAASRADPDANEKRTAAHGTERISRTEMRRTAAGKRAELAPLRRRVVAAEAAIAQFGNEVARIDAELSAPALFSRDPGKGAALAKARAEAVSALEKAEEEWVDASAAYACAMTFLPP